MKKQELIHLHGLFAEVSNTFEQKTDVTVTYPEYEELGMQPTSIHRSKTDHKRAVFALASDILEDLENDAETTPVSAD